MRKASKLIFGLSTALLLLMPFSSIANIPKGSKMHCPSPQQLHRTPGEYSWQSKAPGWEGFFAAPTQAIGYSNKVTHFIQARWVQFSNLPDSPGYVQCDYSGDIGNEIIRFAQTKNKATKRPYGNLWASEQNLKFPSVQRACSAAVDQCDFEQL